MLPPLVPPRLPPLHGLNTWQKELRMTVMIVRWRVMVLARRMLKTWLAKYCVPAPRAAPQAAESIALLPVKNFVFTFWFRLF